MNRILFDFYDKNVSQKININTKIDTIADIVKNYRKNKFPKYNTDLDLEQGYHLFVDFPIQNEDNVYSADSEFEIPTIPTLSLHSVHLNFVLMLLSKSSLKDYFLMLFNRLKDNGILFLRELDFEKSSLKEAKICNELLRFHSNVNLHSNFIIENAFADCGFNIIKIKKVDNYNEYLLIKGIKPYDESQLPAINCVFNDLIPFEPEDKKGQKKFSSKKVHFRKMLSVPPQNDFYWKMVTQFCSDENLVSFMKEKISKDLSKFDIVDMNAGIGGDTIRFMKHFNKVYSVEIYGPAINHIRHNVEVYLEAGALKENNLELYQMDNIDFIKSYNLENKTIVYCDPPWTESKTYNAQYTIDISGYDIERFMSIVKGKCDYLVLKIPIGSLFEINKYKYVSKIIKNDKGKDQLMFVIINMV